VSWSLSAFAVGVVQVRACRRRATRGVDTKADEGRARMSTEENAATCVLGRREA
jgi:hypothetical protein